jgi:hypothetical protein
MGEQTVLGGLDGPNFVCAILWGKNGGSVFRRMAKEHHSIY